MGKKRGKDKSSPSCTHIKKGTDQALLKKLSGNADWTSCQDCKHEENKENISNSVQEEEEEEEEQETAAAWMCLKCGHRGCGRNSENKHAIKHYETPHSEPHCLVISLDRWSVCYICDDEVQYSRTGHLAQLVTSLKKQTTHPMKTAQKKGDKDQQKKSAKKEGIGKTPKSGRSEDSSGVSVKGLSNLGNTCFFNAVIQNLSQTHLLRQTLKKVTEKTSLNITPVASSDLEPLEMQLDQPGSLTLVMCQLLNEIQESKRSVVTPRELFTQVCKAARFKGFQQQDSQELLRYLLDAMRAEETKEYEKNGFPRNFVDHVFGGEMTSTIMCQQCKTVAYRKKSRKKEQNTSESSQGGRGSPAATNVNDNSAVTPGSKYQQKKAKKQAKKQAKEQKSLDTVQQQQEEEDSITDGDSSAMSINNRFTALSKEQHTKESVIDDEELSNIDQEGEDTQLADEMAGVSLDDAFIEDSDASEHVGEREDEALESKEYTVVNQDPELAFHTLAARTTLDKQECSVQSCLFQFTEVETLTQNNSLLCVTCTKSQKNIYTDALKQMLISSPPPVLTLHLKRFQQNGYSICKVNRHVQFPMILDLAPFCGVKCKQTVSEGEAQVMYSLYGIVEHSGTMRSGHYTAYVKGDAEPLRGSWFHISDTSVQPVSESKVQSGQAYLLFYERIQ
uniref:Ubiquitin carboxyl-terminal hydrolase n=1 Tax=Mola mola TaxID=94237 RepID=A0A3Q3VPL2_MOLML